MQMRQKLLLGGTLIVAMMAGAFFLGRAQAGTNAPGSPADPLVTKSYVDQVAAGFATKTEVQQALQAASAATQSASSALQAAQSAAAQVESALSFRVMTIPAGQKLVGGAGAEIVLRSGTAKIVGSAAGGVLDTSAGRDAANGETAPANHLLVVPRADGRGLLAVTDTIVMVRGTAVIAEVGP
jgi:hypothetical protein